MREHIIPYKERLSNKIGQYMEMPVNDRTAAAIKSMTECWEIIDKLEKQVAACGAAPAALTVEDAKMWASEMVNDDDNHTTGPHWTIDQTTSVAGSIGVKFEHISNWCWWVTMNMMYSDFCKVAEQFGVDTPGFYAEMAKAFLFDPDGPAPREKLAAYYYHVVKKY